MKKKVISFLVCGVLAASMFAGCGSSSSSSSSASSKSSDSTATADTSAASSAEETADNAGEEASGEKDLSDVTFAIIARASGNPYCDVELSGFEEVCEEIGEPAHEAHRDCR